MSAIVRAWYPALALVIVALAAPLSAAAQSVEAIVDDAIEAYREQMDGVDDFTVVQHREGQEEERSRVMYFERVEGEEPPVFRSRTVGEPDEGGRGASPWRFFELLRDEGSYEGTETIRGEATHVLRVEDVQDALGSARGRGTSDLTYYLDTDNSWIRRMRIASQGGPGGRNSGGRHVVTVDFLDYREVEGLVYPHRMEMEVDSPAMEEAAARMQEEMEKLPEAQRERMRSMMEGRMGPGMLEGTWIVTEVRVNAGPPEGL